MLNFWENKSEFNKLEFQEGGGGGAYFLHILNFSSRNFKKTSQNFEIIHQYINIVLLPAFLLEMGFSLFIKRKKDLH